MTLNIRLKAIALGCLSASLSTAHPAFAQSSGAVALPQNFETRAELEAQAKTADAKHNKGEAFLIHYRLERGDFRDGDRIVTRVTRGSAGFADTLIVRSGKKVELPQMGELSLDGVLRSELVPKLTAHIGKYIRDPVVQATPLLRVAILGYVGRPGYYYALADVPLSDVLMWAGGPSPFADLKRVLIRREGETIVDENNTYAALTSGMSMDLLHMQAGDEISVGHQKQIPWPMILSGASALLGLVFTFSRLHR